MTEELCPNCESPFSDIQMMGVGANQPSPRFQCGSIFVPVAKRLVVKTYACMKIAELRASIAKPAAVPEAVTKDVIPAGWVFYSADASIQSSNPRRPMTAMIKRDVDGVQWWLQLTEEEKERTSLYSTGAGMTLTLAIQNAVDALLSAADTEVKNGTRN